MSKSFTKALVAGLLLNVLLLPAGLALTDSSYIASSAHEAATRDMLKQLRTRHYVKQDLDDAFSSKLLDAYLDDLDPNRQFLLQSDVASFEKYRHQLDDQIKAYKLSTGFNIFKRYQQRINTQLERTIRDLPTTLAAFDYSTNDSILLDRSEAPWPKDQAEADAIWLKQLKNRSLSLKLAGKTDDEIATLLKKRYSNQLKRLTQLESEDIFQTYANAITSLYDPHTDYFSPRISENFQINMSLKLEGIGAVLQMEDDYTKIVRLVPAGPADKQGELQPADRIIGVAQGYDTEMSDVVGWRLDDVVDLIRGPAGSIVRLNVIPASSQNEAENKEIIIERNEVKLEDQSAKGELLEIAEADGKIRKVGVIDIPTFYLDFEAYRNRDPNYRSTTSDVSRILTDLLAQGAEGIIIDLRDNGGGSLAEASGLVGLFIESGPTVLIRQSNSKIIPEGKRRPSAFYDGPLLVFINRMSASASEIFAGAIQDYKRGLVIGTQSFGKGTVQSVNALSHGQLKLTESKFYRVSGDSTQNRGVIPDILFPALYDKENIGESILDNALHWDQIRTARHQK
ncbi:MAG: S41 family peptidase, partial [Spongiibacteraceae bacterium]